MVTDQQVRRLMKLRKTEKTLATAASRAGMDEKKARKWAALGRFPSQCRQKRKWRTRKDRFEELREGIAGILERIPTVQATGLFDYLCRRHEGWF
jgi:hypothetical protein